jgi:hypothetical protein
MPLASALRGIPVKAGFSHAVTTELFILKHF